MLRCTSVGSSFILWQSVFFSVFVTVIPSLSCSVWQLLSPPPFSLYVFIIRGNFLRTCLDWMTHVLTVKMPSSLRTLKNFVVKTWPERKSSPKIKILTLFLLTTLLMDALITFPEPHEFHRGKEFQPMPIQRKPEVLMYSHVEKNQTEKHNRRKT